MLTTFSTKVLKKELQISEGLHKKHQEKIETLCSKEIKAFRKAQDILMEKLQTVSKQEDVVKLQKKCEKADTKVQNTAQSLISQYEKMLEETYFSKDMTSEEKELQTKQLMDKAHEEFITLNKEFPSIGKAQVLLLIDN